MPPGDSTDENYRLLTFYNFRVEDCPISPEELASCGFYYTNSESRVKCFDCGFEMGDWTMSDNRNSLWHFRECRYFSNSSKLLLLLSMCIFALI